jgi:hypothetical protein
LFIYSFLVLFYFFGKLLSPLARMTTDEIHCVNRTLHFQLALRSALRIKRALRPQHDMGLHNRMWQRQAQAEALCLFRIQIDDNLTSPPSRAQ